jgi:hypothetical protein
MYTGWSIRSLRGLAASRAPAVEVSASVGLLAVRVGAELGGGWWHCRLSGEQVQPDELDRFLVAVIAALGSRHGTLQGPAAREDVAGSRRVHGQSGGGMTRS